MRMKIRMSAVCTICSDSFKNNDELVNTSCGHIYHSSCLRTWLECKSSCPICNYANPNLCKLYMSFDEKGGQDKELEKYVAENRALQEVLDQATCNDVPSSEGKDEVRALAMQLEEMEIGVVRAKDTNEELKNTIEYLNVQNENRVKEITALKAQVVKLSEENEELIQENTQLQIICNQILLN